MLVIQVENKEVKIPQSYSELKLNDWTKLWRIMCKYNLDKQPTTDEGVDELVIDEIALTKELVCELLQLTNEQVNRLEYTQAQEVINVFNTMLDKDTFDKDWGGHSFTHKGETYYFPQHHFDKMTFGEYATLKQYETVLAKNEEQRFDIIAEQMAYSCRKKDEEKETYDLKERTKLFEDINMEIVMKLTFFLHKRIGSLQTITKIYSAQRDKIARQEKLDTSSQDMDGLIQYIE